MTLSFTEKFLPLVVLHVMVQITPNERVDELTGSHFFNAFISLINSPFLLCLKFGAMHVDTCSNITFTAKPMTN